MAARRWRLDPERLAAAVGPATRAILFNSPANPTGYVATEAELIAVLDLARARDLWIVADEIYGRLTYGGRRAPSFHDIMRADDKILFVQTFSKNWAMTGWRIGWLEAPPALGPDDRKSRTILHFGRTGPRSARGGRGARGGRALPRRFSARACVPRATSSPMASPRPGAFASRVRRPPSISSARSKESPDSRRLALRLVDEAGIGVAPGAAFGLGGEGYLRICFARAPDEMAEATRRFARWLAR